MIRKLYASLSIFLGLAIPFSLTAWEGRDHQRMLQEARQYLPLEMRLVLQDVQANLWDESAVRPDRVLHDYQNHVWHVRPDKKGRHYGKAPEKIAAEIETICQLVSLKNSPEKIAAELGIASHYVADINNPLHTDTDPGEKKIHSRYERDFAKSKAHEWSFDGYDYHPGIVNWIEAEATKANLGYQAILTAYQERQGFGAVQNISQTAYERSINDIADLFYDVYRRSGSQLYQYDQVRRSQYQMNLNTASAAELSQIYYIDARLARRLVKHRERQQWEKVEDLLAVKGLSRKRLDKIKQFFTIN